MSKQNTKIGAGLRTEISADSQTNLPGLSVLVGVVFDGLLATIGYQRLAGQRITSGFAV